MKYDCFEKINFDYNEQHVQIYFICEQHFLFFQNQYRTKITLMHQRTYIYIYIYRYFKYSLGYLQNRLH